MEQLAVVCIVLMCVYALVELVSWVRSIIKKRRTASVYGIVTVPDDKGSRAEWEAISLDLDLEEHQWHEQQKALEEYSAVYKRNGNNQ